jgi:hypothetical protein
MRNDHTATVELGIGNRRTLATIVIIRMRTYVDLILPKGRKSFLRRGRRRRGGIVTIRRLFALFSGIQNAISTETAPAGKAVAIQVLRTEIHGVGGELIPPQARFSHPRLIGGIREDAVGVRI